MLNFNAIPFVRNLLPFVTGIFSAVFFKINISVFLLLLVLSLLLWLLFYLDNSSKVKKASFLFLITADLFLFLSGINCCYNYSILNSSDFYGYHINTSQETVWLARVADLPLEKEKTIKVKLEVVAIKSAKGFKNVSGFTMAYFKKPFDKNKINPGDYILVKSRFNEINLPQNPGEFNYKQYMADKNIYYRSFIDSSNVFVTAKNKHNSLMGFGLNIKQDIVSAFKNSELDAEAGSLCTALLSGYDDEVSLETINAFAHSGTLHVLSVSGWHTGILYIVLLFFFNLFDKNNKRKLLRIVLIILALFMFTLITGFSAPVLRAAVMLSLITVGRFYFNHSSENSINILAVSAFFILFFNPLLIRDVGFLLSYSAIIGIVFFEPIITNSIDIENNFLKKLWQLTAVSIAAQISTLPFTLLFFHQFPLWFIFSNMLVIPLCSLLIYLALLFLLKLTFLSPIINLCVKLILTLIHLTDKPGLGYIDGIDFAISDALFLTAFIIFIALFITRKSFSFIASAMLVVIVWQSLSLSYVLNIKNQTVLTIYQLNKQSAFSFKNKSSLLCNYIGDQNNYNYHIKPDHTAYNYPDVLNIKADYLSTKNFSVFNLNTEAKNSLAYYLKPEYIIVSNDARVNFENLSQNSNLIMLIADASNTYQHLNYLKKQCSKFGIKFYSVKEKGFLSIYRK